MARAGCRSMLAGMESPGMEGCCLLVIAVADRAIGGLLALGIIDISVGARRALGVLAVVVKLYFILVVAAADEGENGDCQSSQSDEESAVRFR